MIPTTLQGWTLDAIETLLRHNYMEQESFDWKERLPDSRNEKRKRGLRCDCRAFANANGVFLVFGVKDDKTLPIDNRIVGLEPHYDFARDFGNFPSECNPSVNWEPRNPAIALPSGRVLHVVHFPRSWRAPHSVKDQNGGVLLPHRTDRGARDHTY